MAEKKKPMGYKEQVRSLHVVAIKKGQHEELSNLHLPNARNIRRDILKCAACWERRIL